MSRCVCCDYSPLTDSYFYSSLVVGGGDKRLFLDTKTGNYYCTSCRSDIKETMTDDWIADHQEELDDPDTLSYLFESGSSDFTYQPWTKRKNENDG